jgi:hypothetical protein
LLGAPADRCYPVSEISGGYKSYRSESRSFREVVVPPVAGSGKSSSNMIR